tara:strand:- start:243 stop:1610 length:1368 start_codon:yes stop_codon:yes gene_type:complete
MMSKDKNTLHPAFYKMMDFFLGAKTKGPMHKAVFNLADRNLLGFNFPTGEQSLAEEKKMFDAYGPSWIDRLEKGLIQPGEMPNNESWGFYYSQHCRGQYDYWQDALKMQFEAQTLHRYLPKNTSLIDFFSDVQFRMPHENTLLMQQYDNNRVIFVHVIEENAKTFKKQRIYPQTTLNRFHKDHPNKIFKSWNLGRKDTVYTACLSVYTNINDQEILSKHEFDPLDIHAITRPICFSFPVSFSFPAGYSLTKTCEHIKPLASSLTKGANGTRLAYEDYSYFLPLFFPEFPFIKGKKLITNKKEFSDGFLQKINTQINTLKDGILMCNELIFSAMSHMSIYGHPDFKAFCVRQLKKEGLTPIQLSYHEGKPFNRLTQKPKYEHYLLDLTIPAESDDHTDGRSGKKRYHLVRGHMMRTREGGFTWRKSHWRGNRKLGVITKDYNIKIDKRIKKEAQAS